MRSCSFAGSLQRLFGGAGRGLTVGVLCASLVEVPLFAEMPPAVHAAPKPVANGEVEGQQRVLHALNRFTFGPRPGDVEQVERMGLERWFDQQLNPQSIDDSALNARLAAFPAMQLPQEQLLQHFPTPQMIRAAARRDLPLPRDPVERALYVDGIAADNAAQARKAAGQADSGEPADSSMDKSMGKSPDSHGMGRSQEMAEPGAAAGKPRMGAAGRVDLLGPEDAEYTLGGGKKQKATPAPGDPEEANARGANRGRATHNENAFPEAQVSAILAEPPDARVRSVLALAPPDLVRFRRSLSQEELQALGRDLAPAQKEILAALGGSQRLIAAEVLQSRLERDVYSQRQLEAVMTDFWLNHFNVYLRKNQNEPLPPARL